LNNEFISTGELPRQKKVEKATLRNGQLARLHGHRVARESKEITHVPQMEEAASSSQCSDELLRQ